VHVPAASGDAETGVAETAPKPSVTDVYSTLKLDVTVDSIMMQLFSGDTDLVCVTHLKLLTEHENG